MFLSMITELFKLVIKALLIWQKQGDIFIPYRILLERRENIKGLNVKDMHVVC